MGGSNAEANAAALTSAIKQANGAKVIVHSSEDFTCDPIALTDCPINLEFTGPGRRVGDNQFLSFVASFSGIQAISGLTDTTATIDGVSTPVTKLQVADASAYMRGDLARVVSDDLEPESDGGDRRKGEAAPVLFVEVGAIYVPRLMDTAAYVTAPRVGRYSRLRCRIEGLTTKGSLSAVSHALVTLEGYARPEGYDLTFANAGWIALQLIGCAYGRFSRVNGDGLGNSAGSLGYMVNDVSGHGNEFSDVRGQFWRHMLTTNMNTVAAGSADIGRFGMCRYHAVLNGIAESCQGAAFDEHAGSYGTEWNNCKALSAVTGAIQRFAFQVRGINSRVIECASDASYSRHVSVSSQASGVVRIAGGAQKSRVFSGAGKSGTQIILDRVDCDSSGSQCIDAGAGAIVYVNGGRFKRTTTGNFGTVADVADGASIYLNNPLFELDYAAGTTSGRIFAAAAGAKRIHGKYRVRLTNTGAVLSHVYNQSTDLSLIVAAQLIGDNTQSTGISSSAAPLESKYSVADLTPGGTNHRTNITTIDDVVRYMVTM